MLDRIDTPSLARRLATEHFQIRGDALVAGGRTVAEIAEQYGTPLFIYDANVIRQCHARLAAAIGDFAEIFFSIKANPLPDVARVLVHCGTGIEIASGGEYARAIAAGAAPGRILFAGPGKRDDELRTVIDDGIAEIHLETDEEIGRVARIATSTGTTVPVAIRINPVASAQGGAMRMGGKPSPFGFDEERLGDVITAVQAQPHLDLCGVHVFAGTQILDAGTLLTQWRHGLALASRAAQMIGRPLRSIDLGGGLGIPYHEGDGALDLAGIAAGLPELRQQKQGDRFIRDARIVVEPGRYLVGPCGLYVMRVNARKMSRGTRFLVTDGGMHHHLAASGNLGQVMKRDYPILAPARMSDRNLAPATVVGPLCTPLDTLARKASLPDLQAGDLLAVMQSGAYGLSASPTGFLSHPLPAEVVVGSMIG